MLIQVFTKSISKSNEYLLIHSHYLDCVNLEKKHLLYKAENQYLADLYNVGFAMKEVIETDRKIGIVHREFNFVSVYKGQKAAYSNKNWIEYKSGLRRNVTIYTENETLYNDLKTSFCSIAESLTTRVFNRVLQVKKEFSIGIGFLNENQITDDLIEHWRKQYKD